MWTIKNEGIYRLENDGKILGIVSEMEDRWRWEIDQPGDQKTGDDCWGFADSLEEAQQKAEQKLKAYGMLS